MEYEVIADPWLFGSDQLIVTLSEFKTVVGADGVSGF